MYNHKDLEKIQSFARTKIDNIITNFNKFYVLVDNRHIVEAYFKPSSRNIFVIGFYNGETQQFNLEDENDLHELCFTQFSLYILSKVF